MSELKHSPYQSQHACVFFTKQPRNKNIGLVDRVESRAAWIGQCSYFNIANTSMKYLSRKYCLHYQVDARVMAHLIEKCGINLKGQINIYQGQAWWYETRANMARELDVSKSTIERSVRRLRKMGLLIAKNLSIYKTDRTLFYTLHPSIWANHFKNSGVQPIEIKHDVTVKPSIKEDLNNIKNININKSYQERGNAPPPSFNPPAPRVEAFKNIQETKKPNAYYVPNMKAVMKRHGFNPNDAELALEVIESIGKEKNMLIKNPVGFFIKDCTPNENGMLIGNVMVRVRDIKHNREKHSFRDCRPLEIATGIKGPECKKGGFKSFLQALEFG